MALHLIWPIEDEVMWPVIILTRIHLVLISPTREGQIGEYIPLPIRVHGPPNRQSQLQRIRMLAFSGVLSFVSVRKVRLLLGHMNSSA
jgi:hypothetical protein